MAEGTIANQILWPTDKKIVVRACFLHVGQGSSILLLVRDKETYRVLLVDSNLDEGAEGINLARMLKDLLTDEKLYAFINTHPHNDHLKGLDEIQEEIEIENVWHSGFDPGKDHDADYKVLQALIKDVKANGGDELEIKGSRAVTPLFDASYYMLAPAEHVKEDIDGKEGDARYDYIHEYCAVLRFGKVGSAGESWILVTGDADRKAFSEHITNYHKDRLPSFVLDAPHHGSRHFFKKPGDDEDVFMEALDAINPTYVVVSAPRSSESRFEHPHDDAMKIYREKVGKDNVFHTGAKRKSFIFDIYEDGTPGDPLDDDGKLAKNYGISEDEDDGGDRGEKAAFTAPAGAPAIQRREYA